MDETFRQVVIYALIPILISGAAYIVKNILDRLNVIEKETVTKLDEPAVRRLVNDKVDPLREDIKELKASTDRILDILLTNKK